MPDTEKPAADDAAPKDAKAKADPQTLEVRAIGSFFENPDFSGRLLQAGDTFTADRVRVAELRANGLVELVTPDPSETPEEDPEPVGGITMRRVRRTAR